MNKLKKYFFVKSYLDTQFYCYHIDWTIRIIWIFGLKVMWIKRIGYSIDVFATLKEAKEFKKERLMEYLSAKRYISK